LEEHPEGQDRCRRPWNSPRLKRVDEVRREVGMVFPALQLFPHLTILENLTLAPIWVRKMPEKQAKRRPCTI
jgi:general L-amino acid transport system ATP-binding protein